MSAQATPGLDRYRCLLACTVWILGACFLVTLWFRYAGPALADPEAGFVAGLWTRISDAPLYQLFVGSGLGIIGYSLALFASLAPTATMPLARRLCGLPPDVLATAAGRDTLTGQGADFALSPVRDAAAIFPGLGFLGTVIGVSIAIGGLDTVVETGNTDDLMLGLRSAFDTTFFGLSVSIILSVLMTLIRARRTRIEASGTHPLPDTA